MNSVKKKIGIMIMCCLMVAGIFAGTVLADNNTIEWKNSSKDTDWYETVNMNVGDTMTFSLKNDYWNAGWSRTYSISVVINDNSEDNYNSEEAVKYVTVECNSLNVGYNKTKVFKITANKSTCSLEDGMVKVRIKNDNNVYTINVFVGHTEIEDPAVNPTCTQTGLTAGSHCSVCNATIVEQETLPALGHKYTEYVSNDDATCLENGTETAKCDRCSETETREEEGSAKGHNEVADVAVAPTCTQPGRTAGSHCSECGAQLSESKEIPTSNHSWMYQRKIGKTVIVRCADCGTVESMSIYNFVYNIVSYWIPSYLR